MAACRQSAVMVWGQVLSKAWRGAMYEMHVGTAATGSGLVWHVVARQDSAALCGQPLRTDDVAETDRHCLSCMTVFQDRLQRVTE